MFYEMLLHFLMLILLATLIVIVSLIILLTCWVIYAFRQRGALQCLLLGIYSHQLSTAPNVLSAKSKISPLILLAADSFNLNVYLMINKEMRFTETPIGNLALHNFFKKCNLKVIF